MSRILRGWDYDPARVSARWITGLDGMPKVQLRLDLGVLQMEMEGRPDGSTPRGFPSLLDYYLSLERKAPASHPALKLNEEACAELQQEAVQYYYRYLSFSALGHLDGLVSDTEHNLRLFEFVAKHAADEELAWQFLQFYPYVRMMNGRAQAEKAIEQKNYDRAIAAVEEALTHIQRFWKEYGEEEDERHCEEIEILKAELISLKRRKPKTEADRLQEDLDHAIATENYEKAAVLRDALNSLSRRRRRTGSERS